MITKIHICEIHMTDREHIQTLLTVAKRYWLEQATQAEIAAEIGYSRSMVSRLLDEARRRGIITFTVQHPLQRAIELEQDLTRTFGLACARVAMSDDDSAAHEVSRMASDLVTTYMHPDSVIALSNGRGVASVVRAMTPTRHPEATVVQAIGGTARGNLLLDSPELCRQLAERLGCAYRVMPAPVLVSNPQVAAALKAEKSIGMTIAMASHADILVTGVGAVGVNSVAPIFDHVMPERAHAELLSRGAVGHICGHHIDAQGRHVDAGFCQGLMTIPIDRIPSITHVIVSAFGAEKAPALTAILRGNLVTDLVTDIATAKAVLDPRG